MTRRPDDDQLGSEMESFDDDLMFDASPDWFEERRAGDDDDVDEDLGYRGLLDEPEELSKAWRHQTPIFVRRPRAHRSERRGGSRAG